MKSCVLWLVVVMLLLASACSPSTADSAPPAPATATPEPDTTAITLADQTAEEPQEEDPPEGEVDPAPVEEEEPYELPEGVNFVYDDGGRTHLALVERVITEANEQFLKIFGSQVTEATIFIFADIEELQRTVTQFLDTRLEYINLHEGTPAQAWPRSIGLYTANQRPGENVIVHELFHVLQHELAHPDGSLLPLVPNWMSEGQADYASVLVREALSRQSGRDFYADCRGNATPLAELEDDHLRRDQNPLRYCYGFNATELLVENSGAGSIIEYWARQGQGEPWKEAFNNSFGKTVEEFYEEFDEWNALGAEMLVFPYNCESGSPDTDVPLRAATDELQVIFVGPTEPLDTVEGLPAGTRFYRFAVTGVDVWQDLTHEELSRALILPRGNVGWGQAGRQAPNEIVVFMGPHAAPGTYRVGLKLPDGRKADTEFQHPC